MKSNFMFILLTEKFTKMWSNQDLRKALIHFKPMLLDLYHSATGKIAKKILFNASDKLLKCVIYVLYNIAVGNISLDKTLYPKLYKSKRASYLSKKLGSKSKLKKILKYPRKKQVDFLGHFSSQFPILLKKLLDHSFSQKSNELEKK